mgnify:CR=1
NNWSATLDAKTLKEIDDMMSWRLTTSENVPWLTIGKALEKIEELMPSCLPDAQDMLTEYRSDLLELKSNPLQRKN